MIGIEEDANDVVAEDVFGFSEASTGGAWGRLADEDGVEVLIIVPDPGARFAAYGFSVARLALAESSTRFMSPREPPLRNSSNSGLRVILGMWTSLSWAGGRLCSGQDG